MTKHQDARFQGGYTRTIQAISKIFPMYELSLDGLEKAVTKLMEKA